MLRDESASAEALWRRSMYVTRTHLTRLTAIAFTTAAIIWATAQSARGDSGWTSWQSLGSDIPRSLPNEESFRLTSAPFLNGNRLILTVDRTGKWLAYIEERQGFWSRWYFLNHPREIYPLVTMTTNATPQPILFYRGKDGFVWFTEVAHPGTGANGETQWTYHASLGRPLDAVPNLIYALRLSERRVAICFTDAAGSTIRCRIRQADGAWGEWTSSTRAPGAIGLPLTSQLDSDYRMHFFANSADTLYELPEGGRSMLGGAWRTIGRIPSGLRLAAPMAGLNADGRLEVFARGSDNTMWHIYQQPGTATWSSWESLGRPPGVDLPFGFVGDAVAQNDDRRLEVFIVAGDSEVWHIYQTRPNCCWSAWENLGKPMSEHKLLPELRVVRRRNSKLELFALDQVGTLWTTYQQ